MKGIITLIAAMMIGIFIGKIVFEPANGAQQNVDVVAQLTPQVDSNHHPVAPSSDQSSSTSNTAPLTAETLDERCLPLIADALSTRESKKNLPEYQEVDTPHPVFGAGTLDIDAIDKRLSHEAPDDQWAFYLKPIVTDYFKKNDLNGAYKSHELDCKYTACKLVAKFALTSQEDMIKMHQIAHRGEFIGPRITSESRCDAERNCKLSLYFSRDPKNDPNMTSIPWRRYPTQD